METKKQHLRKINRFDYYVQIFLLGITACFIYGALYLELEYLKMMDFTSSAELPDSPLFLIFTFTQISFVRFLALFLFLGYSCLVIDSLKRTDFQLDPVSNKIKSLTKNTNSIEVSENVFYVYSIIVSSFYMSFFMLMIMSLHETMNLDLILDFNLKPIEGIYTNKNSVYLFYLIGTILHFIVSNLIKKPKNNKYERTFMLQNFLFVVFILFSYSEELNAANIGHNYKEFDLTLIFQGLFFYLICSYLFISFVKVISIIQEKNIKIGKVKLRRLKIKENKGVSKGKYFDLYTNEHKHKHFKIKDGFLIKKEDLFLPILQISTISVFSLFLVFNYLGESKPYSQVNINGQNYVYRYNNNVSHEDNSYIVESFVKYSLGGNFIYLENKDDLFQLYKISKENNKNKAFINALIQADLSYLKTKRENKEYIQNYKLKDFNDTNLFINYAFNKKLINSIDFDKAIKLNELLLDDKFNEAKDIYSKFILNNLKTEDKDRVAEHGLYTGMAFFFLQDSGYLKINEKSLEFEDSYKDNRKSILENESKVNENDLDEILKLFN